MTPATDILTPLGHRAGLAREVGRDGPAWIMVFPDGSTERWVLNPETGEYQLDELVCGEVRR